MYAPLVPQRSLSIFTDEQKTLYLQNDE